MARQNVNKTRAKVRLTADDRAEIKRLSKRIRKANEAYFNTDSPVMSDEDYDNYQRQLRALHPNSKLLSQVGVNLRNSKDKVSLPVPMPSLPKIHIGEASFDKWWETHENATIIASDKLDGVSGLYFRTTNGVFLYTRGNGSVGGDISHLIDTVRGLPELKVGEKFRGELVISKSIFARKYAAEFSNSRNLVSGVVNATNKIHPAAKSTAFIVHEQITPKKSLSQAARQLKSRGFVVVQHKIFKAGTSDQVIKYLTDRKSGSKIDIDGLVLEAKGERIAVKGLSEVAEAIVKEIEWNPSRYGLLKPTVVLTKPVTLAGAKVTRATGHNAAFIRELRIGIGSKIRIVRSGEVIPKIIGNLSPKTPAFPPKLSFKWRDKTDIMSTDDGHIDEIIAKRLVYFLVTIGVDRIKVPQVNHLVKDGIDNIPDLINATATKFTNAGMGPAMSQHLANNLRTKLKETDYATLAAASGVFPKSMGTRMLSVIVEALGEKALLKERSKLALKTTLTNTPGLGTVRVKDFIDNVVEFRKFLKTIKWKPSATRRIQMKPGVTDEGFAFTGFRDKVLESMILSFGGRVGGLTKVTKYLVAKPGATGTKVAKANSLGIKILTPTALQKLLS